MSKRNPGIHFHPLPRRQFLGQMAAGMAAGGLPLWAMAEPAKDWPSKPVTWVVPFPAGGGTDAFARPLSSQFSKTTGKTLVIDNKGGAGGTLGASYATRQPHDGYTFFMGGTHHVIAPSVYPKLDYDIQKDLVPLDLLATVPQVLVINPKKLPIKNMQELLAQLRANPGKMTFASAGAGSSHHLAGELFKIQSKTDIMHVPYKGAGPALQDLIAGNVDMLFDGLGSSAAHIAAGRIKCLMVAGDKRNPSLPDVPCAAEVGLPDYNVTTWYGLWAIKGTSPEVQARMVEEVKRMGASEEIKAVWAKNGADYGSMTQPQFATFVNEEVKRWAAVVKASGAKIE